MRNRVIYNSQECILSMNLGRCDVFLESRWVWTIASTQTMKCGGNNNTFTCERFHIYSQRLSISMCPLFYFHIISLNIYFTKRKKERKNYNEISCSFGWVLVDFLLCVIYSRSLYRHNCLLILSFSFDCNLFILPSARVCLRLEFQILQYIHLW